VSEVFGMLDEAAASAAKAGGAARLEAALRAFGLHALRLHGRASRGDGRDRVAEGLCHAEPAVRAAALRAAGELGRRDLGALIARSQGDPGSDCRSWGVWARAIFGDEAAAGALAEIALSSAAGPWHGRALDVAVRVARPEEAEALVRGAFARGRERDAIDAAAAWGDPRTVPWLLGLFDTPRLARLAGWAFATITGIDLAAAKIVKDAPEGFRAGPSDSAFEHEVRMDPDARLPWPDRQRAIACWAERAASVPAGARLLLGRPRDGAALADALRDGAQRVRRIAAFDLHLSARGGRALASVSAPAFRQARSLTAQVAPDVAPR
jgi:uncharacterized protein (TIGR02270 family)